MEHKAKQDLDVVAAPGDEVIGVLLYAKRLVEQGWMKGAMHFHGNYCAVGAIYDGVDNTRISDSYAVANLETASIKRLRHALDFQLPDWQATADDSAIVIAWNDDETRTKEQVVDTFDRAINGMIT